MPHEIFHYKTWNDIELTAGRLGISLPHSDDLAVLNTPLKIGAFTAHNRIALQPMEGTDGTETGSPGELTVRRYLRFAEGGAGLIWFEAVATAPEVRASAHQLMLTQENLDAFKRLAEQIKEAGLKKNGFAPVIVMQATNSGRYSKPHGYPEPLIAYSNPLFEDTPLPQNCILTDDQLKMYEERFGETARLAQTAGFDGMDVKCCHRYLACELLSAYTRPGAYGGSFENRIRFLLNAYRAAKANITGDFFLTSRLNVYDGFSYPYGFGVAPNSGLAPRLDEAKCLVGILRSEMDIPIINVTAGNPYKNPHVNRPYDHGNYVPDEHPLVGVDRMMRCVSEIQHCFPDLPVIGSAFSYLRQFAPYLAAGMVAQGSCAMAGFGRMAFADPGFPNKILSGQTLDAPCVTCGGCAKLLRAGSPAGCIVRDRQFYSLEALK
ncbi:MAG: flavin oxidoreductase/NADH oxidase [Clostridiales bacterium]|nr:flavin oxidoreductase/NADH oxidase [Clostridiales bacterium]